MHTQGGRGERVSGPTEIEGVVPRMMGMDGGGWRRQRVEVNSPR